MFMNRHNSFKRILKNKIKINTVLCFANAYNFLSKLLGVAYLLFILSDEKKFYYTK